MSHTIRLFSAALLLPVFALSPVPESLAREWTWHNPLPQGNDLHAFAAGEDFLVAVGHQGTLLRTEDGQNWSPVDSGTTASLNAAASGGGTIVAAGAGGIISSGDGFSWSRVFQNDGVVVEDIVYGDGVWMGTGSMENDSGPGTTAVVLRSANGIDWDLVEQESVAQLRLGEAIAGGANGRFLLAGVEFLTSQESSLLVSDDGGLTWDPVAGSPGTRLNALAWNGTSFAGAGTSGIITFSENGTDWEERHASGFRLTDIKHAGGYWFAVGYSSGEGLEPRVVYSADGIGWNETSLDGTNGLLGTGFFDEKFFLLGFRGILLSGHTPHELALDSSPNTLPLSGVAFGNELWVAVGGDTPAEARGVEEWLPGSGDGQRIVMISSGLDDWTAIETGADTPLYGVAYGNGQFVAVGHAGTVITSVNGSEWTEQDSTTDETLNAVAHGDGYFVAVGGEGIVRYSQDGMLWQEPATLPETTKAYRDITYGDGRFVAVASADSIIHASSPTQWSTASTPAGLYNDRIFSVTHRSNGFVAAGIYDYTHHVPPPERAPLLLASENGDDWVEAETTADFPLTAAGAYGKDYLVAGGYYDFYYRQGHTQAHTSPDGRDWESLIPFPRPGIFWDFHYTGTELVGVGDGGMIVSTSPGHPFFANHPQPVHAIQRETVELSAEAVDPLDGDLAYQWFRDGGPVEDDDRVSGAQTSRLIIDNVGPADAGVYTVAVTNAETTVTSDEALLQVTAVFRVSLHFDENTPGWEIDRFAAVQDAIDAAPEEQESRIIVEPGTYYENINLSGRPAMLTGTDPGNPDTVQATVLDGSANEASVITVDSGEDDRTVIRGLTVRNGKGENFLAGGIHIENATPLIERNRIVSNTAEIWGGGVYISAPEADSPVRILDNYIRSNTSNTGGGIYVRSAPVIISGNIISDNHAVFSAGGGINVYHPLSGQTVEIRNNLILRNEAAGEGGGIRLRNTEGVITGTVVAWNRAGVSGGGIRLIDITESEIIENSVVHGNTAPAASAVHVDRRRNKRVVDFINNIVSLNRGETDTLSGSIAIRYSNFWRNETADPLPENLPYGTDGNTALDPLFVDPENDNFRLQSQAGRWDPGTSDWVTDADHSPLIAAGEPESDGHRPNLGAYGLRETASRPLQEPVVSLAPAWPGYADKVNGKPVPLILSRTGPLGEALPVEASITGNAVEGVDYEVSGTLDGFSEGEAAIAVEVTPLPHDSIRGNRSLVYSVGDADGFIAGGQSSPVLPVLDLPYYSWIAKNFPEPEWEDANQIAPSADPSGTGLSNLARFAFALAVDHAGRIRLPRIVMEHPADSSGDAPVPTIVFTRPVRHSDLHYILEVSDDLAEWEERTPEIVEIESSGDAPEETVTWRVADPPDDTDTRRFMRIRVVMTDDPTLP